MTAPPPLKLLVLGVPLLILVLAGMAVTAFLAVNLVIAGATEGQYASVLVGGLLGVLWLFMLVKTLRGRPLGRAQSR